MGQQYWATPDYEDVFKAKEPELAGHPKPWGVVYARPNPDGSRKKCSNCMMWVKGVNKCAIHRKSLRVVNNMVCGYHVFGKPMDKWMDHPGMQPVDPKYSGLDLVKGGTSCDICRYYGPRTATTGKCYAVANDKDNPADVHAKGCCSRWEKTT